MSFGQIFKFLFFPGLPTWSMYAIERHFREYERGTQSACESKSVLLDGTSATRHTPVIRTQVRCSG